MSAFRLSKWYLDCVAGDGSAVIGYWARLRIGALRVHYAAALLSTHGNPFHTVSSLRATQPPRVRGTRCEWDCEPLGLRGAWVAQSPSFGKTLLRAAQGTIRWHCVQPRSEARITIPASGANRHSLELTGYGYVEKLDLTVPPWRLPFDTLLWGRFASDAHALAWLEWRATHGHARSRRRLAVLDGRPIAKPIIARSLVCLPAAGELSLHDARTIRGGPLVKTTLRDIPGLMRMLPASFSRAHEHKQLSRAVLQLSNEPPSCGWAIHEVVRW